MLIDTLPISLGVALAYGFVLWSMVSIACTWINGRFSLLCSTRFHDITKTRFRYTVNAIDVGHADVLVWLCVDVRDPDRSEVRVVARVLLIQNNQGEFVFGRMYVC